MTIQYSRLRVDKIVDGTDITGLIVWISAVDDADSDPTTNSARIDGYVEFDPPKTTLTKADINAAVTAVRAQKNKASDTIDTQLAKQIAGQQGAKEVQAVDYDSLSAS